MAVSGFRSRSLVLVRVPRRWPGPDGPLPGKPGVSPYAGEVVLALALSVAGGLARGGDWAQAALWACAGRGEVGAVALGLAREAVAEAQRVSDEVVVWA